VADVLPEFLKRPEDSGRIGLRRASSWPHRQGAPRHAYANRLITFHDLNDDRNPWSWRSTLGRS
jgi:hypothetical protein